MSLMKTISNIYVAVGLANIGYAGASAIHETIGEIKGVQVPKEVREIQKPYQQMFNGVGEIGDVGGYILHGSLGLFLIISGAGMKENERKCRKLEESVA